MKSADVKILLVEDNIHDAEMTIRALKKVNLEGLLVHLENGRKRLIFFLPKINSQTAR